MCHVDMYAYLHIYIYVYVYLYIHAYIYGGLGGIHAQASRSAEGLCSGTTKRPNNYMFSYIYIYIYRYILTIYATHLYR